MNLGQGAALETARQLALRGGGHSLRRLRDDGRRRPAPRPGRRRARARDRGRRGRRLRQPLPRRLERSRGPPRAPPRRRASSSGPSPGSASPTRTTGCAPSAGGRSSAGPHSPEPHGARDRDQAARVPRGGPLVVVEVPVTVRYTRESLAKGQTSLGAVVIVRDLLLQYLFGERRMNLAAASLSSSSLASSSSTGRRCAGKNRRALLLELAAFVAGAFFIAFPERATDARALRRASAAASTSSSTRRHLARARVAPHAPPPAGGRRAA